MSSREKRDGFPAWCSKAAFSASRSTVKAMCSESAASSNGLDSARLAGVRREVTNWHSCLAIAATASSGVAYAFRMPSDTSASTLPSLTPGTIATSGTGVGLLGLLFRMRCPNARSVLSWSLLCHATCIASDPSSGTKWSARESPT